VILWYIDRFGLPGKYYTTWLIAIKSAGIEAQSTRVISLHKILNRQLLQRYASRKAPTWIPEAETVIKSTMRNLNESLKPQAVVLSSPESLAVLGLHPDHATLHKLRGSVYDIDGIPHIVILPISAWNVMVNQKDIGAANYGFESVEDFNSGIITAHADASGTFGVAGRTLRPSMSGERDSDVRGSDDSEREAGRLDDQTVVEDLGGDSEEDSDEGETGDVHSEHGRGDDDVREDVDSDPSDGLVDKEDQVEDAFFYEPVLSPVGRFTITADIGKLRRIIDKGWNSDGPTSPIVLRYR